MAEEEKKEQEEEVSEKEALENSKNPERTKKYIDKLQEEKKKYKNVLDSLYPDAPPEEQQQAFKKDTDPKAYKNLSQEQIDERVKNMVDKDGYLDGKKLVSVLSELDSKADRAEKRAAQAERQAQMEAAAREKAQKTAKMREVHAKYPQLDPESKENFNERFYEAVRNDLIGQMMDGKEDPMEAADKWAKLFASKQEEEQEMTKTKEEQEKKEEQKKQIGATRPRSSSMVGYHKDTEEDILKKKIQKGEKGALAELLRRRGM